ncbi:MAG: type II toxin-antitoxin system CcdA family antitoxin [Pseudomonadota bacterium]|nr:type II toxin-antitoxin system CcdA family antitoxin [Pseudomonadota bacterium]
MNLRMEPGMGVEHKVPKRAVNLSVREDLVRAAKAEGVVFSRVFEQALERALRERQAARWADENREAIEHHRRRIEARGMWNAELVRF